MPAGELSDAAGIALKKQKKKTKGYKGNGDDIHHYSFYKEYMCVCIYMCVYIYIYIYFFLFTVTPATYGSSGLEVKSELQLLAYAIACGNTRSLTH